MRSFITKIYHLVNSLKSRNWQLLAPRSGLFAALGADVMLLQVFEESGRQGNGER